MSTGAGGGFPLPLDRYTGEEGQGLWAVLSARAAADPLNLVGIVTPGARVSPFSGQVIAYVEGLPVEVGELGAVLSRLQRRAAP